MVCVLFQHAPDGTHYTPPQSTSVQPRTIDGRTGVREKNKLKRFRRRVYWCHYCCYMRKWWFFLFAHDFYVPGKLYFDILHIDTMAGKNASIPKTSFQSIANCMYDERTRKQQNTKERIKAFTHTRHTHVALRHVCSNIMYTVDVDV